MKIWTSAYQLYPKGTLHLDQPHKFRNGTLLRIEFDSEGVGYSDLCPYPQFGDAPLSVELQNIVRGQPSVLAQRSIIHAKRDASARRRKKSLYNEMRIKNHFFISEFMNFDFKRIPVLQGQRFTEFKVKIGSDLILETEMLKELFDRTAPDVKIRVDFNSRISRQKFSAWLERNQSWLLPKIDFIEDPFSYDPVEWKMLQEKYKIDFALDLAADPLANGAQGANVIVIKPATQDPLKIVEAFGDQEKRFVLTHYMDFPIGQMSAYVDAQELAAESKYQIGVCGLQHHDVYEGFTFQDMICNDGPFIVPPAGYGIGFDEILERQDWTQLI